MSEPSMPHARKPVGRRPSIVAGAGLLVTALVVAVMIAAGSAQSVAGAAPAAAPAVPVAAKATSSTAQSDMPQHTLPSPAATRPSAAAARPSPAATRPSAAAQHTSSTAPRRSTAGTGRATMAPSTGNWMTDLVPQIDPDGKATWVFGRNGGWGASDGHTIYIDPDVPADKRFSVLVHEYGHVLQARVYGSLDASIAAMSALTGAASSDIAANESAADCIALLQGATWVNYGCDDALRAAARAILAGHRP